jgi:hypothetical protein
MRIRTTVAAAALAGAALIAALIGAAPPDTTAPPPADADRPYTVMDDYVNSLIHQHRNLDRAVPSRAPGATAIPMCEPR